MGIVGILGLVGLMGLIGLGLTLRLCGALSLPALTPSHRLLAHVHLGTLTPGTCAIRWT